MIYAAVIASISIVLLMLSAPYRLKGVYFWQKKDNEFRAQITFLGIVVGNLHLRKYKTGLKIFINGKMINQNDKIKRIIKKISINSFYNNIKHTNIVFVNKVNLLLQKSNFLVWSIYSVLTKMFELVYLNNDKNFVFDIKTYNTENETDNFLSGNVKVKISIIDILGVMVNYGKN